LDGGPDWTKQKKNRLGQATVIVVHAVCGEKREEEREKKRRKKEIEI
jgi:hypothetical protein